MFERYTEKARRVIFFARYEASQFGSPVIEADFILLGMQRETSRLFNLSLKAGVPNFRGYLNSRLKKGPRIPTKIDLPLSYEANVTVAYAAQEADGFGHKHIGPEHLLIGLLRVPRTAEILNAFGITLEMAREAAATQKPVTGNFRIKIDAKPRQVRWRL